jgi:Concanavalin A-like lectin/glucanases superfamily
MHKLALATLLTATSVACTVEDTTPPLHGQADAQTNKTSSGSSGSGGQTNTSGTAGTSVVVGSGGTTSGSAGSAVAGSDGTGGASGSGGSDQLDASMSQGDGFDGYVPKPIVYCDGGTTYSGMSLKLDGNSSYGTFARPVQDDFTLEAWIKTSTSQPGGEFWQGIGLFHADVQGGNNDFGAAILNDTFAFGMGLGPGGSDVTLQASTPVDNGQWMHVASTRNKTTGEVQLFINGMLEQSSTYSQQTNSLTASAILTIGGNTVDGRYFVGELDEVRIWNVVRTPAEIAANMFKKLAGTETGLVSYFKFDDTSAATAADTSPTHLDLTLKGNATRVASTAPLCQP